MKVILVRHGETDYNKNRMIQGTIDIPLNETGRKQAKDAASKLSLHQIDCAYCSTLNRAIETAQILLQESNINVSLTQDARLVERSYGELEGTSFDVYQNSRGQAIYQTIEAKELVTKRMQSFIREKYQENPNQVMLVVAHGACIRILLESFNLIPNRAEIEKNKENLSRYLIIPNTSFTTIEYREDTVTMHSFAQ